MNKLSPGKYFDGAYRQAAEAIESGDEANFRAAIAHLNVNAPGRENMSLMWYAIVKKNYPAIRDLISTGYQPDKPEVELGTPLHVALMANDLGILRAMLDGGLSPDIQSKEGGTTLLQRATEAEKALEHVRLLVEHGANVNLRDVIGGSALLDAISVSNPEVATYLIEHGADVNTHLTNGVSIAWAVQISIDGLDPRAKQAPITAFSTDDDGKLTSTVEIPPAPGLSPEGQALLKKYQELRALMIEKGAKFPPDPPAKVRELAEHQ